MKPAIIVVVVVAVLGIGGYTLTQNSSDSTKSTSNNSPSKPADSSTNPSTHSDSKSQTGTKFIINANDETADVTTLNVKKGDTISVTFKVETSEVYHGGLEFKSDVVSSKPIKSGDSDTVTFIADKSFSFTPYWYQSNIKKDYLVTVSVQP